MNGPCRTSCGNMPRRLPIYLTTDVHGNVMASRNRTAPVRIMYAGHCDQIGMLITQIDDYGYLYAETIGGWDPQQLIGQRMTIWTEQEPVPAVISRKPIHLLNDQERKQVVKLDELWLDIGAQDKQEAADVVCIGDPVTLELGFQPTAQPIGQRSRNGRQDGFVGGVRGVAARATARPAVRTYWRSRPSKRKLACAGPKPVLLILPRRWPSPSMSPMPPTVRLSTNGSGERSRWVRDRLSSAGPI